MKNKIFIFGKNSIISKSFVSNVDSEINDIIFITSKGLKKDICCNLGKLMDKNKIIELTKNLEKSDEFQQKIMILFSWSGGPRNLDLENDTWSTNMNIILNFIAFCRNIKPSKIIFLSSAGTIYPQENEYKYKEYDDIDLSNQYGKQKFVAEQILLNFSNQNNIDISILRVASAYGFDERFNDQGVINKWIHSILMNKKLTLYNSPKSKINFISFNQISIAIKYCINNKISGIYNIGTNISLSLEEILEEIKIISRKNPNIEYLSSNYRNFNLDTSKFFLESGITFESYLKDDIKIIYELIKDSLQK